MTPDNYPPAASESSFSRLPKQNWQSSTAIPHHKHRSSWKRSYMKAIYSRLRRLENAAVAG